VRLAARQQRIADELREECRQWSVPLDAIALYELQPKWDAWNQLRRQVSYQAKEASCADVAAARDRAPQRGCVACNARPPAGEEGTERHWHKPVI
jgi:hypothetical protein